MLASVFEKASLNKDLIPKNHAVCCLNPYPTPSLDKLLLKISFEEKTSISIIYMDVCMPLKNCYPLLYLTFQNLLSQFLLHYFQYLPDVLFKVTKFHRISDRKASCKYFQS